MLTYYHRCPEERSKVWINSQSYYVGPGELWWKNNSISDQTCSFHHQTWHLAVTLGYFATAHQLSGTAAELHVDQAADQMLPKGNHFIHVGSPGWVQAKAAKLWLTKTTPEKVVAQKINRLLYLLATYDSA